MLWLWWLRFIDNSSFSATEKLCLRMLAIVENSNLDYETYLKNIELFNNKGAKK